MTFRESLPLWSQRLVVVVFLGMQFSCNEDIDLGKLPPFTHAFVANLGSHTVSVIDLKSFKNVKTIAVGKSPGRLAASPIDDLVFVANLNSSSISVIDSNTHILQKTISVGRTPTDIVFSSDGRLAY